MNSFSAYGSQPDGWGDAPADCEQEQSTCPQCGRSFDIGDGIDGWEDDEEFCDIDCLKKSYPEMTIREIN